MAIHYDFYPNSGIADEGQWHVRALEGETVEAPTLFERIEQRSTLTQADMKGALSALVAGIAEALKDGNRVHLEGLGHFSVSIKGKVVTTEDGALRLDKAGVRSILFRPDRSFLQRLSTADFIRNSKQGRHSPAVSDEVVLAAIGQLEESGQAATCKTLSQRLRMAPATTYRRLQSFQERGLVQRSFVGSTAVYRLSEQNLE